MIRPLTTVRPRCCGASEVSAEPMPRPTLKRALVTSVKNSAGFPEHSICLLLQRSYFSNEPLDRLSAERHTSACNFHCLGGLLQIQDQSQATCDSRRLTFRKDVQSPQEHSCHRHFHLLETICGSLPAFVIIHQPIHAEFSYELAPRSRNTRYRSKLCVKSGENNDALARSFTRAGVCRRPGQCICFSSKAPHCPCGSSRDSDSQSSNPKGSNRDQSRNPRGTSRVGIPPDDAILRQRPALAHSIQHAHSLIPLWIGRHSAMRPRARAARPQGVKDAR